MPATLRELAQALKTWTYDLCQPEGRRVGQPGHDCARDYLKAQLAALGCRPYRGDSYELPYRDGDIDFTNLAAIVPGRDRTLPPLLVGAHYDSVIDGPCADDNGAAVAICLAVAQQSLAAGGWERDLLVVFFDAEEPPYFMSAAMGSHRFAAEQFDERGVAFALIYDLVGHDITIPATLLPGDIGVPLLKSLVFMTGAESHPALPETVEAAGLPPNLKLVATVNRNIGDMSDHGAFRVRGVPYLFFSCGRWQHYHMPTDTPDRLNYWKMARLTLLSLRLLERLAATPWEKGGRAEKDAETREKLVAFEARTFQHTLGRVLFPWLLHWAGLISLSTRPDLDQVAKKLLALGL